MSGRVVTFSAKVPSTIEGNEERRKQFGASQCKGSIEQGTPVTWTPNASRTLRRASNTIERSALTGRPGAIRRVLCSLDETHFPSLLAEAFPGVRAAPRQLVQGIDRHTLRNVSMRWGVAEGRGRRRYRGYSPSIQRFCWKTVSNTASRSAPRTAHISKIPVVHSAQSSRGTFRRAIVVCTGSVQLAVTVGCPAWYVFFSRCSECSARRMPSITTTTTTTTTPLP